MSSGAYLSIVTTLSLALATALPARGEEDTFTFRFAPDLSSDCLIRLERVERRLPAAPPAAEVRSEFRAETRVHAERTDSGYRVSYVPISVEQRRDGQVVTNPVLTLVQDVPIVHLLDKEGRLVKVEGFELIAPLVAEKLGVETASRLQHALDARLLETAERKEWDNRFGDFIGRSAKIGDVWKASAVLPPLTPGAQPFETEVSTEFVTWEACHDGEGRCVRVVSRYGQEPGAPHQGSVDRLIEPTTLQIYGERLEREVPGLAISSEVRQYDCGQKPVGS